MNSHQQPQKSKTNEKYFKQKKKEYYAQNCHLTTFMRKPEDKKTVKEVKQAQQKNNKVAKKATTTQLANQD